MVTPNSHSGSFFFFFKASGKGGLFGFEFHFTKLVLKGFQLEEFERQPTPSQLGSVSWISRVRRVGQNHRAGGKKPVISTSPFFENHPGLGPACCLHQTSKTVEPRPVSAGSNVTFTPPPLRGCPQLKYQSGGKKKKWPPISPGPPTKRPISHQPNKVTALAFGETYSVWFSNASFGNLCNPVPMPGVDGQGAGSRTSPPAPRSSSLHRIAGQRTGAELSSIIQPFPGNGG